ncbi:hypothetical protein U1Q18_022454 [Sarracenia purpurea var. burkii]
MTILLHRSSRERDQEVRASAGARSSSFLIRGREALEQLSSLSPDRCIKATEHVISSPPDPEQLIVVAGRWLLRSFGPLLRLRSQLFLSPLLIFPISHIPHFFVDPGDRISPGDAVRITVEENNPRISETGVLHSGAEGFWAPRRCTRSSDK